MNIVFIDSEGFEDRPKLKSLGELGKLTLLQSGNYLDHLEELASAEVLVSNGTAIDRDLLQKTKAKYIALSTTGYDFVNQADCREYGVKVSNIPGYATEGVAQLVITHLLNLFGKFYDSVAAVKQGKWEESKQFSLWRQDTQLIMGKTLGIIGYGNIGKKVGELAQGLGMNILPLDIRNQKEFQDSIASCHAISIHLPLTNQTRHSINKEVLQAMSPEAFLLNSSRGEVVDESALLQALQEGWIAGAGLDVVSQEPPEDNPLFQQANCYVTPHVGWAFNEARDKAIEEVYENIAQFIKGEYQHLIF